MAILRNILEWRFVVIFDSRGGDFVLKLSGHTGQEYENSSSATGSQILFKKIFSRDIFFCIQILQRKTNVMHSHNTEIEILTQAVAKEGQHSKKTKKSQNRRSKKDFQER